MCMCVSVSVCMCEIYRQFLMPRAQVHFTMGQLRENNGKPGQREMGDCLHPKITVL